MRLSARLFYSSLLSLRVSCPLVYRSSPVSRPLLSRVSFQQPPASRSFATVMGSVKRIAEDLEKPDLDDRSYRVIELPNKLEALLVHDAETDKASASLNVNVGNFSDEEDMPGMAHAVEHLLFMGTEKYPVENEYSSYLSSNSGHSNAYTAATQTNYFFECAASHEANDNTPNGVVNGTSNGVAKGPLYGALDRFAQFFVKPLFLESTLDRELRAVDSENKKNLQSDAWRLSQLAKSLSNPRHPYHHFSTGNLQTLRDDPEKRGVKIRDEFIRFYERHYSANRMKLVVLGRESLDELEEWVVELFSEVKNKDLPQNRWDGVEILTKDQLSNEIFAKPVMESRSLEISFPWQDEEDMYETQPARYISHLIGHEGPGSILAYLKDRGLAQTLSAGYHSVCPGSAFFEIEIGLTPEGLKNYHEIVKIVFQYIGMMKANPPVQWLHEEMKNMAEVDFRFRQKSPASRFTSGTSSVMQKKLPRNLLLSGTSKFRKFDAEAITQAMEYLREDNFRLMLVSQEYPGDWDQREKWYGTEYKVEKIPTDVLSDVRKALSSHGNETIKELHLPHKNEFIPTKLDVEKTEVKEPAKTPKLLRNDDLVRLWWKKDDTFWVPKANLNLKLRNPVTSANPANYVKTVLFVSLVKDALSSYSYDAEISGLAYGVAPTMLGVDLSVHGYNDKMAVLLEKILTTMKTIEIKADRFEIIKERMARKYKNWSFQQPYYQIGDYTRWILNERGWMNDLFAAELPHITVDDIKTFGPQLLQQAHIEVLAHGNLYKEDAKKIASLVESILKPRPLPPALWEVRRNLIIPQGSNFVYKQKLSDPANINNAIEYYLDVGHVMDIPLRAKLQLFAQMTDEPSFDQLRTKEQLGYVVWSGVRPASITMGYRVLIQSERDPDYLESRINAFLVKFKQDMESMSDEEFEGHKRSLINKRLEKLKNLDFETNRLWAYISGEYFNFYQVDHDVAEIRQLTKDDIKEFFAQYIDPESPTRAKVSVHLEAQATQAPAEISPAEQRDQLVGLTVQVLRSLGVEVEEDKLKPALAKVDLVDDGQIVEAVQDHIGATQEVVEQLEEAVPRMQVALKIKSAAPPTDGVEVAAKIPAPVLIEDPYKWKAGLKVSQGPIAVEDIRSFEDVESKL
ncbi:metalloprotease [Exophiala dermatitidis]|uniref:Metalloprotease n=1 Tax=Exophiala dermatitidis TaxID=5970 RepID=A0AAN6IVF7_EXODE|nr:metalloprotease [Exophiala dermatitidis]KAJ4521716.1 metalloprotease [Exophiala dermatitidis]KAJ4539408.1 metalloprotease [Exophiala dermatitidis]KAJ4548514.1 metalloprotease [Exophiala dermatitidis]KAJ4562828.1 metalloprotease [Exophiala dermatitidis]